MAKLGDKTCARRIMEQSNVPVIPGMNEPEADPRRLLEVAEQLGYPVLVKAAAGGGGKGMRIVDRPENLVAAAEMATSEARSAFGDGSIYLEKYLDRPRHVEFQILADAHGNVIHLFERECSIQRRHQKIIEETPSPGLTHDIRERMAEAAVSAARAAGYVNAGTVEFLLDRSGAFYFLEVNTRLQVEHPITEMTTGLDLVRHQLEIAAGRPLPFTQDDITRRGHAIECRIYAEDPEAGFMPASGKILLFRPAEGPGIRYDHGVYAGFQVPVHYDPILGKLIVWAEDRTSAIARMVRALKESPILGVKTPTEFLLDVLCCPEFQSGATHSRFIEEHFADWKPDALADTLAAVGFAIHDMTVPSRVTEQVAMASAETLSPWNRLGAWDMCR
jgi:acetyl/propionyl-CoA carboxylase alpha subunit